MKRKELIRQLTEAGCVYLRPGSNHDIEQGFSLAMQRTIAFFDKYPNNWMELCGLKDINEGVTITVPEKKEDIKETNIVPRETLQENKISQQEQELNGNKFHVLRQIIAKNNQ